MSEVLQKDRECLAVESKKFNVCKVNQHTANTLVILHLPLSIAKGLDVSFIKKYVAKTRKNILRRKK